MHSIMYYNICAVKIKGIKKEKVWGFLSSSQ